MEVSPNQYGIYFRVCSVQTAGNVTQDSVHYQDAVLDWTEHVCYY